MAEYDPVNRPLHYCEGRKIEPVEVIEDWGLSPHLANVVKYVARWEKKGGIEDLKKARWWLDRFINFLEPPKPR